MFLWKNVPANEIGNETKDETTDNSTLQKPSSLVPDFAFGIRKMQSFAGHVGDAVVNVGDDEAAEKVSYKLQFLQTYANLAPSFAKCNIPYPTF